MTTQGPATQAVLVFRETGLTPRQLADDRAQCLVLLAQQAMRQADLLSALKRLHAAVEHESGHAEEKAAAVAAMRKTEGG